MSQDLRKLSVSTLAQESASSVRLQNEDGASSVEKWRKAQPLFALSVLLARKQ